MIAVDTNVLVYAHREDSAHHGVASPVLRDLANGSRPWAIAMQSLVEFVGIVTHPRVYAPPTPLETALATVEGLVSVPSLRILAAGLEDWPVLAEAFRRGRVRGPRVHDAHIAAVCRDHGVTEILTADRRFPRLRGLRVRDILV